MMFDDWDAISREYNGLDQIDVWRVDAVAATRD